MGRFVAYKQWFGPCNECMFIYMPSMRVEVDCDDEHSEMNKLCLDISGISFIEGSGFAVLKRTAAIM